MSKATISNGRRLMILRRQSSTCSSLSSLTYSHPSSHAWWWTSPVGSIFSRFHNDKATSGKDTGSQSRSGFTFSRSLEWFLQYTRPTCWTLLSVKWKVSWVDRFSESKTDLLQSPVLSTSRSSLTGGWTGRLGSTPQFIWSTPLPCCEGETSKFKVVDSSKKTFHIAMQSSLLIN